MRILFVVGGSYKAFYINHLPKYKKIDLLIFQKNIIYDYDYYNELFGDKIVTNEVLSLSKKVGCKIVALVKTNLLGIVNEEVLYCDGKDVKILSSERFFDLNVNSADVCFNINRITKISQNLTIVLNFNNLEMEYVYPKHKQVVIICNNNKIMYFNIRKSNRIFSKICYFSLNF